ncbi:histidine phosphatase family protein [Rivibacter subsaxonicus]|uniref:Phosphoglycerate mutase n=1 Tax=Rivibacter subsaxonicus TaxID=457575 RepID=A0A4V2FU36_9BURK|nr:histidine phosphatase family protein [Rivibacter subsaxonicus]RZU00526.1 phosphoglycerate mutase [Rivibacter subsaxonicus]
MADAAATDGDAHQPVRVLAIRHGETAWNVDTRIQGQLDIGLNDTGRWQATRLAEALADEGIDAIYSSDLSRALDTARSVAGRIELPVQTDTGLRERHFGSFEGQTWAEIEQRHPAESLRWRKREPGFGPPGGETLQGFYERVVETASRLVAGHRGKTVALVAHGGVLDCLYRAATRIELDAPRTWQLRNAGINRLLHTQAGFMLVGWGDTAHLEAAAEAPRDESQDRAGPAA